MAIDMIIRLSYYIRYGTDEDFNSRNGNRHEKRIKIILCHLDYDDVI